jgi:hypothetical protein
MKIPKPRLQKSSSNFVSVLASSTKSRALLLIVLLILVIGGGLIIANYLGSSDKKQEQEISQKLENLNNKEDLTCDDIIKEIGSYSPESTGNEEDKRALLERQMVCFTGQQQYDKAIFAAETLQDFYNARSDSSNADRIEQEIQDLKSLKVYKDQEAANVESGNEQ